MAPSTSTKTHLIKRHGHIEKYDERKVYASVYSACLNCHYSERQAEKVALLVMKKVNAVVRSKAAIDSADIRKAIIRELGDRHVAMMYTHHLDLC